MCICTYLHSSYKVHMYAYMYNLRTCLQVLYAQFKTVKIGSLSYAEDDGKHVLGIKTPAADESQGYCCHVLECADEVCTWYRYAYIHKTPLCSKFLWSKIFVDHELCVHKTFFSKCKASR